jgi:hypothetical protein
VTPTDHDVDAGARGGLSRRQLIKAAGIVGAAAWTAPVIIDSLSSPAAAATVAPGCYFAYSAATSSGTWQAWQTAQPGNTGPTCAPSGGGCTPTASAAALAALNLPTPNISDGGTQLVTVSVKGGFSCRIVSLTATVQAGADADTCASSGGSNITNNHVAFAGQPSTSVTLNPNGTVQWDAAAGNTSMIGAILRCP